MQMDVDYFLRETFESSVAMGKEGLRRLGLDPAKVDDIVQEFRRRDQERFSIQQAEGQFAGVDKVFGRYDETTSQE
jgi:voltage-gated potassium channel Kch